MPVHPPSACYCHIIDTGLSNIERHNLNGAIDQLDNELQHLRAVTEILTEVLLYTPSDPRYNPSIHDRYWDEVRPRFISRADRDSVREFVVAWGFLALVTRGTDFRDSLRNSNSV